MSKYYKVEVTRLYKPVATLTQTRPHKQEFSYVPNEKLTNSDLAYSLAKTISNISERIIDIRFEENKQTDKIIVFIEVQENE